MEMLSGVMSVMEEVSLSLGRLREGVWFDHDVPPLARASRFSRASCVHLPSKYWHIL